LEADQNPLIKWEINSISQKDPFLTTLNAIYEVVQIVARHMGKEVQAGDEAGERPSVLVLDEVKEEAHRWLNLLFEKSQFFAELAADTSKIPDARKTSRYSLLLRPVGLIAFYLAVQAALDESRGRQSDIAKVIEKLLILDWDHSSTFWKGIMVNNKGNITNRQSDIQLAGDLAAWMICGDESTPQFKKDLIERHQKQLGSLEATLPEVQA
jgi:hypothetical protein